MKKLVLGSAILAVLGMTSSAMAAPNVGTVNFTGAVTSATCEVSLKDNNGQSITNVNLGAIGTSATGGTAVDFKLVPQDPTCLAKTQANVSWTSPTLGTDGITNSATNGTNAYMVMKATNATQTGTAANVKEGQTSFDYTAARGATLASFNYQATLTKPTAAFTAGPFSASASYVVVYK